MDVNWHFMLRFTSVIQTLNWGEEYTLETCINFSIGNAELLVQASKEQKCSLNPLVNPIVADYFNQGTKNIF